MGQVDTGRFRTFARWPWTTLQAIASLRRVTIDKPVALLRWLAFA